MDTKGHTAEKSIAVVCAQTLKICHVPFWGGESAPSVWKGTKMKRAGRLWMFSRSFIKTLPKRELFWVSFLLVGLRSWFFRFIGVRSGHFHDEFYAGTNAFGTTAVAIVRIYLLF